MHDAEMGILFVLRRPPVPAKTMSRPLGECVEVFNVFPVGDGHQSIAACSSHWHGARFAEICLEISQESSLKCRPLLTPPFFAVFFGVLPHVLKITAHGLETWGENTQGAVKD